MNRYERKMRHKREMKRRWKNKLGGYGEYWKEFYLSGVREYAKEAGNRRVRAMYRDLLAVVDDENSEDLIAMSQAEYRKYFDYAWTIW